MGGSEDADKRVYPFEDWYVHPSLVDLDHVTRIIRQNANKPLIGYNGLPVLYYKDINYSTATAPQAPVAPKTPVAPKAATAPKVSTAPKAHAPKAPKVPAPKAPVAPKAATAPKAPAAKAPKVPTAPKAPAVKTLVAPKAPVISTGGIEMGAFS